MILRMEAAKKLGDHALRGAAIPHYLAEIRRETSRVIADTGLRFVFLLFQAHSRRILVAAEPMGPKKRARPLCTCHVLSERDTAAPGVR
jgi:hypothetical protein